jgi:hypothetical protein
LFGGEELNGSFPARADLSAPDLPKSGLSTPDPSNLDAQSGAFVIPRNPNPISTPLVTAQQQLRVRCSCEYTVTLLRRSRPFFCS